MTWDKRILTTFHLHVYVECEMNQGWARPGKEMLYADQRLGRAQPRTSMLFCRKQKVVYGSTCHLKNKDEVRLNHGLMIRSRTRSWHLNETTSHIKESM